MDLRLGAHATGSQLEGGSDMKITFNDAVGAAYTGIALLVVSYVALMQNSAEAMTALVGVVGAGVGYFLRGKLTRPDGS